MSAQGNAALQTEITNAITNLLQTEGITPQTLGQVLSDLSASAWNNVDTALTLPPVSMTIAQLASAIGTSALNPLQWVQITNRPDGNPLWVQGLGTNLVSPFGIWVVSGKPILVVMDYTSGYEGNTKPFLLSFDSSQKLYLSQITGNSNAGINTILKASASLSFGTVAGQGKSDQNITVTGAAVGDPVMLGSDVGVMGSAAYHCVAFVSSANTVTVRFINTTASSVSVPTGTFNVTIIK